MKVFKVLFVAFLMVFSAAAFSQVSLGTASSFKVLAGQDVTNTGPSTIAN